MPAIELSQLNHDLILELFELTLSTDAVGNPIVTPGQTLWFCNQSYQGFEVLFRGNTYNAFPIVASNFSVSAGGQAETANITLSNVNTGLMPLIRQYDDLVNCRLIRRRVLYKHIDGLVSGAQYTPFPTANPNALLEESYWYLDRVEFNKLEVKWDLRRLRDLGNYQLPGRVVAANLCGFQYRKWTALGFNYAGTSECQYSGSAYFDLNDNQVYDPSKDSCSHTLKACELRNNSTRFGGFPGAGQINYAN